MISLFLSLLFFTLLIISCCGISLHLYMLCIAIVGLLESYLYLVLLRHLNKTGCTDCVEAVALLAFVALFGGTKEALLRVIISPLSIKNFAAILYDSFSLSPLFQIMSIAMHILHHLLYDKFAKHGVAYHRCKSV